MPAGSVDRPTPLCASRYESSRLGRRRWHPNLAEMARTALEDRGQILDELAAAVDQLALALACLGEAFELLAVDAAERLEAELFRPVQRAYAQSKRTHDRFAERAALPNREFEPPSPGVSSQGASVFV